MEWDGNGNIDRTFFPTEDRDAGIKILSGKFETLFQSQQALIENCYTLDSQTLPLVNLKMNDKKITGLANGTILSDAVNYSQLSDLEDKVDDNTTAIENIAAPKGYINGGVISNNDTTPDSIIDVAAVKARSSDDTQDINVSAGSLDISDDTAWASGTAPTLTDASVFVWAVYDETTPYFILDDATGSNVTVAKRRVGALITDSSDDIVGFTATEVAGGGVSYVYATEIADVNDTTSAKTSRDLSIPNGINLEVLGIAFIKQDSASPRNLYVYDGNDNRFWFGVILSNARNVESMFVGIRTSTASISTYVDGSIQSLQVRINGYNDERIV